MNIVKQYQPITSEKIAEKLNLTRAALRTDLAVLTMLEILDAKPKVGYVFNDMPSHSDLYEHIKKIKVSEIMSKPVVVNEESTIYDAIVHLFLNDVGTLFVEQRGSLVGAVSRKDFLKAAMGGTDLHKLPIGIIMTRMPNIIYVNKDDSAYSAAKKIIDHQVDSLPVVNKDGEDKFEIIGKVSKTNITKLFVKLGQNL